jgi:fibronectin-binding autotransporter adhesin
MKTKNNRITSQFACLLLLSGALAAHAQTTYIKAANTTALGTSGSWTTAGFPGTGDIGEWTSVATATGDTLTSIGGAFSMGDIQIGNNVAGNVSITDTTAGDILTLNGATGSGVGIDMSAANHNLTLGTPLKINANQTWNIKSGDTLTINGQNNPQFGANVLTITGGGTLDYFFSDAPVTAASSSTGAGLVISNSTFTATMQLTTSASYTGYLGGTAGTPTIALTMAGSTFTCGEAASSGHAEQSFTSLTLDGGASIFGFSTSRGSSSGDCVGFAALSRNAGSMADFNANAGTTAWGLNNQQAYALAGSAVLGYATYAANDWLMPHGATTIDGLATGYTADVFTTATNDVNETISDSPTAFTINSLRFNVAAANTLTLTSVNTITTGGILFGSTVAANNTVITGGSLTSGNTTADGFHDLIVVNNTASSGNIIINSVIADNGGNSIGLTVGTTSTTTPTGSVQLGAANTFSGTTTIIKGRLALTNSLALQNSTFNTTQPGTLVLTNVTLNNAATFGGLSGSGNLVLPASFALTLGNNNVSSTYSGVLSGTGATVTKVGTGTLTLNGANANTGNTTVSAGTLALGASGVFGGAASLAATSTLDVSAAGNYSLAGTVSGTGTINGALTLAGGGALSPTGISGMLTLNSNLTLNGGTCQINFDAGLHTNNIITIGAGGSGNLTNLTGTISVNITDGTLANGTYKVIGVPHGTITGSGSLLAVSGFSQTGQTAAMVANSGELDLVVSTYIAQNLVWLGDGSANLWNVNSALNWNDTGPTVADPSVFKNGDNTILDNTSGNLTVNLNGTLSPATVTVNGSQSYTITSTGKISGSASLTNNSSGTLTILTTNDYTGGSVINSGAIQVGNGTTAGGKIGSGSVLDNAALIFDLPAGSQSMGAVSGSGTLTTTGAGTLVLNSADTLAGATTITTGIIKQGAPNVLPNGGGVGDTTANGTLDLGGQSGSINGLFGGGFINNSGSSAATLSVLGSSSINPSLFSGVIENTSGTLALNFNGIYGNELQLTANNTYTGGTTVTAGTLQLGDTSAISSGGLNVVTGGTLDVNGFSPAIDSLNGGGTIDDVSAGGTITLSIGNNNGSGNFSGVIQNSSGTVNLVKNGTGTETLSGDNTYSGSTANTNGTLAVTVNGTINTTTLIGSGFVVNGGTVNVSGTSTFADGLEFLESAGTVTAGTFFTPNDASGSPTIEITGGTFNGAVSMSRIVDYATAPTAAAPIAANQANGFYVDGTSAIANLTTLTIGTANSSASARMDAGTLNVSGELLVGDQTTEGRWDIFQVNGGFFTGSDTGNGIVIAPNNGGSFNDSEVYFSGPSTNEVGIINFGLASDATGGGTGWLFVNGGASLFMGSGGIVKPTTVGYTANIELTSGVLGATASWFSSLPMNLNGTGFTIQTSDPLGNPWDIALSGVLSETASSSLTVDGGGVLTLSGANQYNSGTAVTGSTLNINGINALGGANYAGLTLTNGILQYAAGASGNGSLDLTLPAASIIGSTGIWLALGDDTIDLNGNSVTYAHANGLFGGGQLELNSTLPGGSLNLTATNSYTSGTIVGSGATLYVNNTSGSATGSGGVTVASGGLLGGNGFIAGAVEITGGGTNAPGNSSVGTNTVASLKLDSSAVNNIQFGGSVNGQTVVANPNGFVLNDGFDTVLFNLYQGGGTAPFTTPGTYNLIQFTGTAPSLDSSWTTVSGSNAHIGNPQPTSVYSFGISGGYLKVTIAGNGSSVAATWTNSVGGNWTTGVDWNSNPLFPTAVGDSATFGTGTGFSAVTLNASETVGTLTFDNNNSYEIANAGKTLTIDNTPAAASIYVLGGTANSIQTAVALNENTAITVSSAQSLALSGVVSNTLTATAALSVTGGGTLALSHSNAYGPAASSGFGTTVNGPTLQVGNNGALAAGDVSIAGNSTLQAGAAGLNLGNNIDIAPGVTVTVNNNGNSLTLGGVISDSGALTEIGSGTLTLNGVNTYSGNTTVNAGVLSISAAGNVQSTPAINLNGGDLLGNGTFTVSPNIGIGPVSGSVPGTALIDAASTQAFTVQGNIGSAGNTGTNNLVVNSGAGNTGEVILSGANTFNGTTVVSNGLLDVQSATALQNSTINYNNWGGDLVFDGSISATTLGGLTGTQNLALTNLGGSGITLTIGNNASSTTYSGSLNDAGLGGALTKAGLGTLTLAGVNNNYNGATTVSAGVLQLNTNGVITCGSASLTANGGGELLVNGGTLIVTNTSAVNAGTVGLLVSAGSATFLGALDEQNNQDTVELIETTGGSLTAGSIALGRSGFIATAQPAAGTTADGLYVDGGTVNIIGNLDMSSATANESSVSTRVDAGSLTVGGAVIIGLNNGGRWSVMDVNGGSLTVPDVVTGISVGGPNAGDAELLIRAGTTTAGIIGLGSGTVADTVVLDQTNGSLYLGSGGIVQVSPNATASITLDGGLLGAVASWSCMNAIQLGGTSYTIQTADTNGNPQNISLGGAISGTGALVKTGTGTLVLSNPDTCSGSTTISNGTLALVPGGSLSTPQIAIASGATFDVSALGGFTVTGSSPVQTLAGVSSSGAASVNATGNTLTLASGAGALLNASGGAGPTVGKVSVTGALALNGNSITINVNNNILGAGSYRLLDCTGSLTGTANSTPLFTGLGATPGATASVSTTSGAAGHVDLTVTKATPILETATASTITNGNPLSTSILSVTFTNAAGTVVPGTAVFNSPGATPGVGTANQLVTFTPTDTTDYNTPAAFNVSVTVVPSIIAPTDKAHITSFSLVGTNVVLSATNGDNGATYYLVTSTNVAAPLNQWKTIWTNVAGSTNFTFTATNAVKLNDAEQFYLLSSTNFNP